MDAHLCPNSHQVGSIDLTTELSSDDETPPMSNTNATGKAAINVISLDVTSPERQDDYDRDNGNGLHAIVSISARSLQLQTMRSSLDDHTRPAPTTNANNSATADDGDTLDCDDLIAIALGDSTQDGSTQEMEEFDESEHMTQVAMDRLFLSHAQSRVRAALAGVDSFASTCTSTLLPSWSSSSIRSCSVSSARDSASFVSQSTDSGNDDNDVVYDKTVVVDQQPRPNQEPVSAASASKTGKRAPNLTAQRRQQREAEKAQQKQAKEQQKLEAKRKRETERSERQGKRRRTKVDACKEISIHFDARAMAQDTSGDITSIISALQKGRLVQAPRATDEEQESLSHKDRVPCEHEYSLDNERPDLQVTAHKFVVSSATLPLANCIVWTRNLQPDPTYQTTAPVLEVDKIEPFVVVRMQASEFVAWVASDSYATECAQLRSTFPAPIQITIILRNYDKLKREYMSKQKRELTLRMPSRPSPSPTPDAPSMLLCSSLYSESANVPKSRCW
jgi:hypothetical protein